jgi:hypothetical protein
VALSGVVTIVGGRGAITSSGQKGCFLTKVWGLWGRVFISDRRCIGIDGSQNSQIPEFSAKK